MPVGAEEVQCTQLPPQCQATAPLICCLILLSPVGAADVVSPVWQTANAKMTKH